MATSSVSCTIPKDANCKENFCIWPGISCFFPSFFVVIRAKPRRARKKRKNPARGLSFVPRVCYTI